MEALRRRAADVVQTWWEKLRRTPMYCARPYSATSTNPENVRQTISELPVDMPTAAERPNVEASSAANPDSGRCSAESV